MTSLSARPRHLGILITGSGILIAGCAALAVTAPVVAAGPTRAPTGPALAAEKGCSACHNVRTRAVGPSYVAIAKRYTAKNKAALTNSVLNGSKRKWGATPMPANKDLGVTRAEASKLVDWILTQK